MLRRLIAMATATAFSLGTMSVVQAQSFTLTSPDVAEGKPITAAQYWSNFGSTGEIVRGRRNIGDLTGGNASSAARTPQ